MPYPLEAVAQLYRDRWASLLRYIFQRITASIAPVPASTALPAAE